MSKTEGAAQRAIVTNPLPESDSLLLAVVNAVAAAESESAVSLPPLSEAVDVEALETVVEGGNSGVTVSFTYHEHHVVITDERVEVY